MFGDQVLIGTLSPLELLTYSKVSNDWRICKRINRAIGPIIPARSSPLSKGLIAGSRARYNWPASCFRVDALCLTQENSSGPARPAARGGRQRREQPAHLNIQMPGGRVGIPVDFAGGVRHAWKSALDAAATATTAVGVGSTAFTLTPALVPRSLRRSGDQETCDLHQDGIPHACATAAAASSRLDAAG
jgi:hypothetical protein